MLNATNRTTRDAEDRFDAGDLALDVLPGRYDWWLDRGEREEMAVEPLAGLWGEEFRRREEIVRRVQELLDPAGERMAVMAIADWVARGRTPREHQLRYERFVDVAAAELAERGLSSNFGTERYVNQEALPGWLGAVVEGQACRNATSAMARREGERTRRFLRPGEEDLPERVATAWTAVGNRWQQMVEPWHGRTPAPCWPCSTSTRAAWIAAWWPHGCRPVRRRNYR
jgi:hypothetical protein